LVIPAIYGNVVDLHLHGILELIIDVVEFTELPAELEVLILEDGLVW